MCTMIAHQVKLEGRGKSGPEWFEVRAAAHQDHPSRARPGRRARRAGRHSRQSLVASVDPRGAVSLDPPRAFPPRYLTSFVSPTAGSRKAIYPHDAQFHARQSSEGCSRGTSKRNATSVGLPSLVTERIDTVTPLSRICWPVVSVGQVRKFCGPRGVTFRVLSSILDTTTASRV